MRIHAFIQVQYVFIGTFILSSLYSCLRHALPIPYPCCLITIILSSISCLSYWIPIPAATCQAEIHSSRPSVRSLKRTVPVPSSEMHNTMPSYIGLIFPAILLLECTERTAPSLCCILTWWWEYILLRAIQGINEKFEITDIWTE